MEPTLCPPTDAGPSSPVGVLAGRSGSRYTIGPAPIGAGAQAEVWPGLRDDGFAVAIKIARPQRSAIDALDAEGRYLEALERGGADCTVTCIDHVEWDGRPGLVLPRLPRDVDALIRARIAADPDRALEGVLLVGVELARALAALHVAQLTRPGEPGCLVHRDVKPENVLIDTTGALRLADLGGSLLADGRVPRELGVFGSPHWAPPDQMLPGLAEPNPTWDTYAACVMVFYWVSGARPSFQADPSARLQPRGRELFRRMNVMAAAKPPERTEAIEALFDMREGVRAADVMDSAASARFEAVDREGLGRGVSRLADAATYGDIAIEEAHEALVAVLERGMSPHVAPSPPHRYWRAAELADALEDIARGLGAARRRRANPPIPPPLEIERTTVHPEWGAHHVVLPDLGSLIVTAPPWQLWEARMRASRGGPVLAAEPPRGPSLRRYAPLVALLGLFLVWPCEAPTASTREPGTPTVRVAGAAAEGALAPFRIMRTEVSNRSYASCVAAGGCEPLGWSAPGSAWELGVGAEGDVFRLLVGDRQPAVGATWAQAASWCAWAGGRLPTEAQWERAAVGPSGAPWPWGVEAPDCTRANLASCGLGLTVAVDSLPPGASTYGAVHLVGNAWEWTDTAAGGDRVLRGGAFDTAAPSVASQRTTRRFDDPERVSPTYSFRCVFPD